MSISQRGILFIIAKTLILAALIASLATNYLLLTSQSFHSRIYGIFAQAGYESSLSEGVLSNIRKLEAEKMVLSQKAGRLAARLESQSANLTKARGITKRIASRTVKNVALNVSSVMEEAAPYIGAVVIVALTAADVKAGCDNIRDINEMKQALDPAAPLESEDEVCGIKVPSVESIMAEIKEHMLGTFNKASKDAKDSAHELYNDLGGTLNEIFMRYSNRP